jgi:hypothetical protein
MRPDPYGTPAQQTLHRIGWQPAAELGPLNIGKRCDNCHHHAWAEGTRTPRPRCALHDIATTARARCRDWAERTEPGPLSDDARAALDRHLRRVAAQEV